MQLENSVQMTKNTKAHETGRKLVFSKGELGNGSLGIFTDLF